MVPRRIRYTTEQSKRVGAAINCCSCCIHSLRFVEVPGLGLKLPRRILESATYVVRVKLP